MTGMATMTGSVTAGRPFKAAQVYIRNTDKRILYMVYTNAGRFRALGLFPGNYEVSVTARGLKSDIQQLAIKAGDAPSLRFSLTDIPTNTESETDVAQNLEGTASNRVLVTLDCISSRFQLFKLRAGSVRIDAIAFSYFLDCMPSDIDAIHPYEIGHRVVVFSGDLHMIPRHISSPFSM